MAYNYQSDTGIVDPDTSTIFANVIAEYKAIFGDDLNVAPETPEGVLIVAETSQRVSLLSNNANLANQINPSQAAGVFLDALMALTGMTRGAATHSTFTLNPIVTGVDGVDVFVGTLFETVAGDRFVATATVEIGLIIPNEASVPCESVETGPIAAGIGDLSVIVPPGLLGVTGISNPVAATLGTNGQSDVSARAERKATLALQGSGISFAIESRVRAVEDVSSLSYLENTAPAPDTIEGILLAANSIWACVSGGTDLDVATALLSAKSPGCAWNNGLAGDAISEDVTDPNSGQIYTVLFDRPTDIPMLFQVTIQITDVSNPVDIIKDAILNYAVGLSAGQEGFVVGADVSPYEIAGAVNIAEPAIIVTLVETATVAAGSGAFDNITIPMGQDERATVDAGSISVVIV